MPPAVAGGYVVDAIGIQKASPHPPATAGGTDPIQVWLVRLGTRFREVVLTKANKEVASIIQKNFRLARQRSVP